MKCIICKIKEKRAGGSYCDDCNRKVARDGYKKHKARYIARAYERNQQLDIWINKLKDAPCTDCGIKYPHYVMEFDHVKGKKVLGVSRMKSRRMAKSKILEEVNKCELVCSNCHRERTNKRHPSRATKNHKL